jgi:hypothetical protein
LPVVAVPVSFGLPVHWSFLAMRCDIWTIFMSKCLERDSEQLS